LTYGARFRNASNNYVTVDEESPSYVYLGKYQIPDQGGGTFDIYVHCVGYPLVFFGLPYNVGPGGGRVDFNACQDRVGIQVMKTAPTNDSATWVITVKVAAQNRTGLNLWLRVFGMLHLNFPNGSWDHYGARFWNSQSQLVFDAGFKQLRLAGNSYSTELALPYMAPDPNRDANDKYDAVVGVPFDLANKSICANARGIIYLPYQYGSYVDFDTQQNINQFYTMAYDTMYWATGNALWARRICTNFGRLDTTDNPSADYSQCQIVYTRICAIDNNLYP